MENNIENNIKNAFRNREIQPSANAWKVLEAQLDTAETIRKSIFFKYLAYASIFVGLFLGLYVFINPSKTKKTQKELITKETPKLKFENLEPKTEITAISTKKEVLTPQKNKNSKTPKTIHQKIAVKKKKNVLKNAVKKDGFSQKNTANLRPILLSKVKKVVDNDNALPVKGKEIAIPKTNSISKGIIATNAVKKKVFTSDAELNQLLISAVNLEMAKKDTAKPSLKIKNNQLLYSLENEINKPIKTRLLDKLLKGTRTVNTYLSRNKN